MKKKILVVEDCQELVVILCKVLETLYQVEATEKFDQEWVETFYPDLILLDVNLPHENGLKICDRLKSHAKLKVIPIFFLTAEESFETKITGLRLGAEDYILKPFHPEELLAKIEAKLKNIGDHKCEETLIVEDYVINFTQGKVSFRQANATQALELSFKESQLLKYLAQNSDRLISREELADKLWPERENFNIRTIDNKITSLRKKIPPLKEIIATVYGRGHIFTLKKSA